VARDGVEPPTRGFSDNAARLAKPHNQISYQISISIYVLFNVLTSGPFVPFTVLNDGDLTYLDIRFYLADFLKGFSRRKRVLIQVGALGHGLTPDHNGP
jgi:hypothetical protein